MDSPREGISYTTILQTMLVDKTIDMLNLASMSRIILKEEYRGKDENWLDAILRAFVCKNVDQFGHQVFSLITNIRNIESTVLLEYEMLYQNLKICLKDDNQKISSLINEMKDFTMNKEIDWATKDNLNKSVWDSSKEVITIFKMFLLSLRIINSFHPNIDVVNELKDISDEIKTIFCAWKIHPCVMIQQTMLADKTKDMSNLVSLSRIILKEEYQGKGENWLDAVLRAFVYKYMDQFGHQIFAPITNIRDIKSTVSLEYEMLYQNLKIRLKNDNQKINEMMRFTKDKKIDWMTKDNLNKSIWDLSKEVISTFKMFLLSLRTINSFKPNTDAVNELEDISDEIETIFCMLKMQNSCVDDRGVSQQINKVNCCVSENVAGNLICNNESSNFVVGKEDTKNISPVSKAETLVDTEMYSCDICSAQFEKYLTYNISYNNHIKSKEHLKFIRNNRHKSTGSSKEDLVQDLNNAFTNFVLSPNFLAKQNDQPNNLCSSYDGNIKISSGTVSKPVQSVIPLVQVKPQVVNNSINNGSESFQTTRASAFEVQSATIVTESLSVFPPESDNHSSCIIVLGGNEYFCSQCRIIIHADELQMHVSGNTHTTAHQNFPSSINENTSSSARDSIQFQSSQRIRDSQLAVSSVDRITQESSSENHSSCTINLRENVHFCLLCKMFTYHADELQMHISGNTHTMAHQKFLSSINENSSFSEFTISEKRELIRRKSKEHSGFIDFIADDFYCILCLCDVGGIPNIEAHVNGKKHLDNCNIRLDELKSELMNSQTGNIATSCRGQKCYMCRLYTTNAFHVSKCLIMSRMSAVLRETRNLSSRLIDHHLYILSTSENNKYKCWLCDCTINGFPNVTSHIKGHLHMSKYKDIYSGTSIKSLPQHVNEKISSSKDSGHCQSSRHTKDSQFAVPSRSKKVKAPPSDNHSCCIIVLPPNTNFCLLCKIIIYRESELKKHIKGNTHTMVHQKFSSYINENTLFSDLTFIDKRELIRRKSKEHSGFIDFTADNFYCILCCCDVGGIWNIETHVNGKKHTDYCTEEVDNFSSEKKIFLTKNISKSRTRQKCYMCQHDTKDSYHVQVCLILSMISASFREDPDLPGWLVDHHLYITTEDDDSNQYDCWLCNCTISGLENVTAHIEGRLHISEYNTIFDNNYRD